MSAAFYADARLGTVTAGDGDAKEDLSVEINEESEAFLFAVAVGLCSLDSRRTVCCLRL